MTTTERTISDRSADLSEELALLTRRAAHHSDLAEAAASCAGDANRIAECVVTDVVAVTTAGELRLRASTDPDFSKASIDVADRLGRSAAADCATRSTHDWRDLHDQDQPGTTTGIVLRSELDVPLAVKGQSLGVLRFFSDQVGHFDDARRRACLLAAEASAIALHSVLLDTTAGELKGALDSNRRIGMAMGILMSRHSVTESAAFDMLRTTSQRLHRKLRSVADDVVISGQLPVLPPLRGPGGGAPAI